MIDIQKRYEVYKSLINADELPLSDDIIYGILKNEMAKELEGDLKLKNPKLLVKEYIDKFKDKEFKTKNIKKDSVFYRGRIGKKDIPGSVNGGDRIFEVPYYGEEIEVAPHLYNLGGRFNRAGVSYLYLATNIETCLAEIHLEVGQKCSIAKFKCKEDMELIDLTEDVNDDLELMILYRILTEPIYNDVKYKYFITQLLAEVLMEFNGNGLYFKSVQSSGYNIVCFDSDKFELEKYSEELYVAKEINYTYELVKDTIKTYAEQCNEHLIDLVQYDLAGKNDELLQYIYDWIKHVRK